ncbi:hypothetical protein M610_gp120 [Alteromonas phage vB_AmaP_AD45-P1]|uniref:hypothetical protein n=1 Tax=Alteromonas phage vB_AmaP_AD45-P1 TaxID=1300004 RepID=UPI0003334FEA|nr:hypothetical protein M610_gp120 [Alteromonas phage vB_AmaP_AD45-P1]AGM46879.1 hypothetical protein AD45P1_00305 [Alteromonas phage vB_AmaP_AD45-P1]
MEQEYNTIKKFYGDKTAKRSGVPLMNHIDEGLEILKSLNASQTELAAFCLHPIVQNSEDVDFVTSMSVLKLAEEYRDKANAYLCRPENDNILFTEQLTPKLDGGMSLSCRRLLFADKVQNQKDFFNLSRIYS